MTKKEFLIRFAEENLNLKFEPKVAESVTSEPTTSRRKLAQKHSNAIKPFVSFGLDEYLLIDGSKLDENEGLIELWSRDSMKEKYPFMQKIAISYSHVAVAETCRESIFSTSNLVVIPNRSRLSSSNLSEMMFVKMNRELIENKDLCCCFPVVM